MVLYYKSTVVDPSAFIYVGKDKFENEDLIKFGWEEDVWFVNNSAVKLASHMTTGAHVYLRLKPGDNWTSIPQALLEDCAQLTKANSIDGNKKDNVTVIYTPWSNLKKDASMATGQVTFHDRKLVKKVHVSQRENSIVNRLNKTKEEKFPDLKAEKDADMRGKRRTERIAREQQKAQDREEERKRDELRWQKDHAYDDLMREENMVSNEERDANFYDDDFM